MSTLFAPFEFEFLFLLQASLELEVKRRSSLHKDNEEGLKFFFMLMSNDKYDVDVTRHSISILVVTLVEWLYADARLVCGVILV